MEVVARDTEDRSLDRDLIETQARPPRRCSQIRIDHQRRYNLNRSRSLRIFFARVISPRLFNLATPLADLFIYFATAKYFPGAHILASSGNSQVKNNVIVVLYVISKLRV